MLIALVVFASAVIPSPFAIERPGPVVDVLGDIELEGEAVPVLKVEGERETASSHQANEGALNLLTVSIAGSPQQPLGWLALIPALFDPSQKIARVAEYYPEGVTVEQREEYNSLQMDASQVQAAAAAFTQLGLEVGTTLSIGGVDEAGPAAGKLKTGDVLNKVNGEPLQNFEQLLETVSAADGPIEFEIAREGEIRIESVQPKAPGPGEDPRLGVVISTTFELPQQVDISVPNIGGPSAGLIFGLAILDRLGETSTLNGLTVSGTGTLNARGEVGAIGGLTQKAWAASQAESDLFLMPMANCGDVEGFPSDLTVAPVATLAEAEAALESAAAGHAVAGLERCGLEG
nr:S16 family serine protease [Leucobacter exalbidus]